MKTPKIVLVDKNGGPSIAQDITLDEYLIYANPGDQLDILGDIATILYKVFSYEANNQYSIKIVYEKKA
ncbi:hypothetical protein OOJ96_06550 [Pseudomonas sp. 15FMM2]|uniref:Uncharacterized protein n=1 Tax=Pseudomonas imrae TaxID=2992837 RepID=A0ACC7PAM6_9PSED